MEKEKIYHSTDDELDSRDNYSDGINKSYLTKKIFKNGYNDYNRSNTSSSYKDHKYKRCESNYSNDYNSKYHSRSRSRSISPKDTRYLNKRYTNYYRSRSRSPYNYSHKKYSYYNYHYHTTKRYDNHIKQMEAAKPSKILGIFGLNSSTNENDLEKEFLPFGDIISIKLIYDRFTNKSRGFGFIKYTTVSDATKAKGMMDGKYLHNRKIRVDYSLTKKPHSPTPGIYLGNSWIIQNNKNY